MYYYGARYYDAKTSVWQSVDPLAEETLDPYGYCHQNPINMIDPTGMKGEKVQNPVYDKNGEFLGTTKSGFTGEAIIMDKKDFKSGMSDNIAKRKGTLLSKFDGFNNMFERTKIEEHIVNYTLNDGLDIDHEINILPTGNDFLYNSDYATKDNMYIFRGKNNDKVFEPTVENLRNLINLHEVKGHVLLGLGGDSKDHRKIYEMQFNHKQFKSTTGRFKQAIMLNYINDGGDYLGKYKGLYNKYGRGIHQRYYDYYQNKIKDYWSIFN